jgi:hypothetical protein
MKKLFIILAFMLTAFAADAQQRITPMMDITHDVYDEAIDLVLVMTRTSHIERCDGIRLDNDFFTTYYGEISLRREGDSSIRIEIVEFTKMLNEHVSYPSRRKYLLNQIQTELILQTADLYEYMSRRLVREQGVKNMCIKVDNRTGGAYIRVDLYR